MEQIDTGFNYLIFPQKRDHLHINVNDDIEANDNLLLSSDSRQICSLMALENTKVCPLKVSLFDDNRITHYEKMNNNASITSPIDTYQHYETNQYSSYLKNKQRSVTDSYPSSPTASILKKKNQEIDSSPQDKPSASTRTRWTKEEENTLIQLVRKAGARRWNQIAAVLKTKTAKQCRDHYANCLDPEIKNSLWTVEEERILLIKYREYGSHWSGIKKYLPGRTTSMIKNYITMLLKKNEKGLSHEFQDLNTYNQQNDQIEDMSSSCNSNAGSDNDDHNFSLNMTSIQDKYDNFSCLDIDCLLNRPKSDIKFV